MKAAPCAGAGWRRWRLWCLLVLVTALWFQSGCEHRSEVTSLNTRTIASTSVRSAFHRGVALKPMNVAFTQDGLHNCGTIAMLIAWVHSYPARAARLVTRIPDGTYLVWFRGMSPIDVSPSDLAAARNARIIKAASDDRWAAIVLTAFTKTKSSPHRLDFNATDWIYAGEIGRTLSGWSASSFNLKAEFQDSRRRIQVGHPIALELIKAKLSQLRGFPVVAYTNRRIHIWAIMDYDQGKGRVLVRNPRRAHPEWMDLPLFSRKFQLLVYTVAPDAEA